MLYAKLAFSKAANTQNISNNSLNLSLISNQARLLATNHISYEVSVINLNAIWLKLALNTSVKNALFTATFSNYYLLGEPLQNLLFQAHIDSFDLYSSEEERKGKHFQKYSEIMSLIMLVLLGLGLFLNSGHLSYQILDYYQLLFMTLFLSIDYPPPLNHFLFGFRYSHYLFLPQIFRPTNSASDYSSATPDKFGVIVPDVHFLNNAGPAFIVIAVATSILILSKLLQVLF